MRLLPFLFVFAFTLLLSCNRSGRHTPEAGDAIETDGNDALYSEIKKVHDEGMELMDATQRAKRELKNKLETGSAPDKTVIETRIAKLDSADKGMMDWMHDFTRPQDTLTDEEYREYLESELIRAKKIRDDMAEALKGAAE
jgi:hypothetical protein